MAAQTRDFHSDYWEDNCRDNSRWVRPRRPSTERAAPPNMMMRRRVVPEENDENDEDVKGPLEARQEREEAEAEAAQSNERNDSGQPYEDSSSPDPKKQKSDL